jgi:uncharacterized protein with HEPN domain
MSRHRDEIVLLDITNAAKLIAAFIEGFKEDTFVDDLKTRSAVLYHLTVIGEATKRLSPEFRQANPQVPWSLMAGMRGHLIHAYDLVDWQEVWITASKDVPELLNLIENIA